MARSKAFALGRMLTALGDGADPAELEQRHARRGNQFALSTPSQPTGDRVKMAFALQIATKSRRTSCNSIRRTRVEYAEVAELSGAVGDARRAACCLWYGMGIADR